MKELKKECYSLIDKIVAKGEINRDNLKIVLAIRLKMPIDRFNIEKFDKNLLEKTIKALKCML